MREKTSTHARQLDLFRQQISVAESNIQAAEDLISSRGRIIGSGARTALADALLTHLAAWTAGGKEADAIARAA